MADELKHRWSISHNPLAGITAGGWWRLLWENGFRISPAYWHRGLFITFCSLINSWFKSKEDRFYRKKVRDTRITEPPLFVLGHWRSG
ncbi:MAG TPA: hypothetical protein VKD72_26720, partial [Gemmataceae bacterium]|nr:hypothetical protein [Gemmataceae bacterium]